MSIACSKVEPRRGRSACEQRTVHAHARAGHGPSDVDHVENSVGRSAAIKTGFAAGKEVEVEVQVEVDLTRAPRSNLTSRVLTRFKSRNGRPVWVLDFLLMFFDVLKPA